MATERSSVICGEVMTISHAAELHQQLRNALEQSTTIELVADKVEKVDTAGIQLLIALSRELDKVGGSILWKDPSAVLLQAAATLGLTSYMKFDQRA
jgi:ABC-type transporter Mla MlaB component